MIVTLASEQPDGVGRCSILVANDRIEKTGHVDRRALGALDVAYDVVDAEGGL